MSSTSQSKPVAVMGATGHTARFVLNELERRGLPAVLIGRDARKLAAINRNYQRSEFRLARVDHPSSLDDALSGAAAVINCAGPFLDTALPVVDAALRAQIPYLDLTAEQAVVQLLETRDAAARDAKVVVVPAAAFYGGLADLLATSIVDGREEVDEILVAVALDSWHPTQGTRITGERNTARRLIVRDGILQPVQDELQEGLWRFPDPFGKQHVAMVPFSETITLSRHFRANSIESYINLAALRDVRDTTTPPPVASDERGRSSQSFIMDVIVRVGTHRWCATAWGQDIYAVSAPIIVEALERILAGETSGKFGVRSLGELFDASVFFERLTGKDSLNVRYETDVRALLELK